MTAASDQYSLFDEKPIERPATFVAGKRSNPLVLQELVGSIRFSCHE